MSHYYEAHVTIEPVIGLRLEQFKEIAADHGFRVANLIMVKDRQPNPDDAFCTSRDAEYHEILARTHELCSHLQDRKFRIYRYKIESTILDSRTYPLFEDVKLSII